VCVPDLVEALHATAACPLRCIQVRGLDAEMSVKHVKLQVSEFISGPWSPLMKTKVSARAKSQQAKLAVRDLQDPCSIHGRCHKAGCFQ
jgi:hypothetical protein